MTVTMVDPRKKLRNTTTGLSTKFGSEGLIAYDIDKKTLVVFDGSTQGGFTLAKDADKENVANKSTNMTTDTGSDTKYPSVKAVETFVNASSSKIVDITDNAATTYTLQLNKLNILDYNNTGSTSITINLPTVSSYASVPECSLMIRNLTAAGLTITWGSTIIYINGMSAIASLAAGAAVYISFMKPYSAQNWISAYGTVEF